MTFALHVLDPDSISSTIYDSIKFGEKWSLNTEPQGSTEHCLVHFTNPIQNKKPQKPKAKELLYPLS